MLQKLKNITYIFVSHVRFNTQKCQKRVPVSRNETDKGETEKKKYFESSGEVRLSSFENWCVFLIFNSPVFKFVKVPEFLKSMMAIFWFRRKKCRTGNKFRKINIYWREKPDNDERLRRLSKWRKIFVEIYRLFFVSATVQNKLTFSLRVLLRINFNFEGIYCGRG